MDNPRANAPDLHARVVAAVETLFHRQAKRGGFDGQHGAYSSMQQSDRAELARVISRMIEASAVEWHEARESHVITDGKERQLTVLEPSDRIVHTVLGRWLSQRIESQLTQGVRAFRRGASSERTVADFGAYVRAHRKQEKNVTARGLFVLRADVASYGESIPVHGQSELWRMLPSEAPFSTLVQEALRPVILGASGARYCRIIGLPTGSALVAPVENLYLAPVDRALEPQAGAFYARYGDDILFAHPHEQAVRAAQVALESSTRQLGLQLNKAKGSLTFFNGAGRPTGSVVGVNAVRYLGYRVDFRGNVSLPADKARRCLRLLRQRLSATARLFATHDPQQRAQALIHACNALLASEPPVGSKDVAVMIRVVNDRSQLAAMDYALCLMLAELLSGQRGVRAFRTHPPARLHDELGLRSLEARRNGKRW